MKKFALIGLVGVLLFFGILVFVPPVAIKVPSAGQHQFEVDEPMQRVRKILVRTNAVKKIVAMADAELLDQQWLDLQFEMDRPILKRDWKIGGSGELTVVMNDSYLGEHELRLEQTVDIVRDRLFVINKLQQPSGPILTYETSLELTPSSSGKASFKTTLNLEIETTANYFTSGLVESQIRKAAQVSLEKQEQAIREIIVEHQDKLIIIPEA